VNKFLSDCNTTASFPHQAVSILLVLVLIYKNTGVPRALPARFSHNPVGISFLTSTHHQSSRGEGTETISIR